MGFKDRYTSKYVKGGGREIHMAKRYINPKIIAGEVKAKQR